MKILRAFILFSFLISSASFLFAETLQQAHTEVELVSDSISVAPGGPFRAAVRFKTEPGWHIYWTNPGDSGLAPEIKWQLPEGWTAGKTEFPYPEKITQDPLVSYGYEHETFLISRINVSSSQPAGDVVLKAAISWLACQVDCIPGKGELSLSLKAGEPAPDPKWVKAFSETQARQPAVLPNIKVESFISGEKLLLRFSSFEKRKSAYFFPDNPELIRHAGEQVLSEVSGRHELEIPLSVNRPEKLARLTGILFSEEGWRGPGSEKALAVDVPLGTAPVSSAGMSVLTALLFAFIGGLILNLMPCVLPVLSLKILSFIKEAAENPGTLFKHGLVFTAGVVFSFWFLAGLLLVFQAAGKYAGWGFQLQSPVFLTVLTLIFFLFALNLLGLFEVGTSLTGVRQGNNKGLAGSFSSGVFATVVATPCTAPFMGAALGFSLSQTPVVSILVFTALGLGMAAPYLLLCSRPELLKFVPKPGAWMVRLKQILALPLFVTCAWLLWVLSLQLGNGILKPVLIGLTLAGEGVWFLGKYQMSGENKFRALAFGLLFCGILLSIHSARIAVPQTARESSGKHLIVWENFSEERLEELLNKNGAVFVDFTAAWCLTCQVNERVALEIPKTAEMFRSMGITALKADWTSQDPEIAKSLAKYGRNSIPLYVFYPAGSRKPILLPELLTPGTVVDFLNRKPEK